MKCLHCGKELPEDLVKLVEEVGIDPYCNEVCFGLDQYGYPVG